MARRRIQPVPVLTGAAFLPHLLPGECVSGVIHES
jgi:hypothetical protein